MDAELPDSADRAIAALAARQHGAISRAQLAAIGLGRGAIANRVATGRLFAIHRGVFLVGHPVPMGRALEMAAVLACGVGAAIGHRSAAAMWCFPCGPAPRQIDVVVARDWAPRRPGIRVHRTLSLTQRDVRRVDEVPVTSPARTLLDLGADLARDDHEAVVADALRRHLVRPVDLEEQLTRNGRLRGAASLRAILETESGPAFTRSAAERRLLALVRNSSLPSPVVNARVAGYEVDFLWPHERVIVEVDGFQWHADRTAFERDRERDAELQALGYRVVRVTWRQLTQEPAAVVRRLERVLQARSGTYA